MPVYDYVCECGHKFEDLVRDSEEEVACPECGQITERQDSAAHIFSTIVPTTRTSKPHKAGYQHLNVNRPATKAQVGAGGSVSADHPTGSTRNRD